MNIHFARTLLSVATLASLASLAACAESDDSITTQDHGDTSTDSIDDAQMNLISVAHRDNGNDVRFYEPSPGQILIVEIGKGMSLPTIDQPVAMFHAAAPGVATPKALVEAQQRFDVIQASAGKKVPQVRDYGVSPTPVDQIKAPEAPVQTIAAGDPCSANNFVEQECTFGDQYWCKVTWSNGFYAYNSSVDWMHNAVCTLSGTITLRLLVDSDLKASYEVPTGYKAKHIWYGSNYSFRSEVINASGDTFRVGGAAGG